MVLIAFTWILPFAFGVDRKQKQSSGTNIGSFQAGSLLRHSTALVKALALSPSDAIPDSILNPAKCLLLAPVVVSRTFVRVPALLTCREGELWQPPVVVRIHGKGHWAASTETALILILKNRAVALLSTPGAGGTMPRVVPGPLVRRMPVVPAALLSADAFAYARQGRKLVPAALNEMHWEQDSTANLVLYGSPIKNGTQGPSTARVTRPFVNSVTSFFNTITPVGIVLHHSGLVPGKKIKQIDENSINEFHEQRGFEIVYFGRMYHVAYHYIILPNGRIQSGRPERCEGAHAVGYNSYLGIVMVGNFSSKDNPSGRIGPKQPTHRQIQSLVKLCRRLRQKYKFPLKRIVRHSDVAATRCPGDRFPYLAVIHEIAGARRSGRIASSKKVSTKAAHRSRPR